MKVFTEHLDHNLIVKMMKIRIATTQTKPPNVYDYLKSFSQEAEDLVDEIKDANNDIEKYKLVFNGNNKEKFSFNIFRIFLFFKNFLSAIYNGETEKKQRSENLAIDQKMQKKNKIQFEYRDKIIETFRNGTFSSEHLKKSDGADSDYVLKDVKNFIQKIESQAENINLNLFKDFFESSSPADYIKDLINTKNPDKNKEIVPKIKSRMSDLKDRIKETSEREKKNKSADKPIKIIEEILEYNRNAQKTFQLHQKLIMENQNQNYKLIHQFLNRCKCQRKDLKL